MLKATYSIDNLIQQPVNGNAFMKSVLMVKIDKKSSLITKAEFRESKLTEAITPLMVVLTRGCH